MRPLPLILTALALAASPALAQQGQPAHFMEQWDGNGDGSVSPDEARSKRGEVFFMFDSDNDGALNASEWALVADHMQAEMDSKAENRPGQGQGKGKGKGANAPGAAMHEAMTPAFNDADGNGVVTEAEFVAATDRLFANLDRNADGAVSSADFAR